MRATASIESHRSAGMQGDLWSAASDDWAAAQEATCRPLFDHALKRTGVRSGTRLLDVGCGAGLAVQMASEMGATAQGLDAAAGMVRVARARVPQAGFDTGEMEALPYGDASFDVVTGFNAFQYATSPVNALIEARRVTIPGGKIVIATWGLPEDCEATPYLKALASRLPPPPPGAAGPFALSEPGKLEALVTPAGLKPIELQIVDCIWVYPDLDTALRALLSAGPAIRAIRHSGASRVRTAVVEALAPFRGADASIRLENKFRYLVAEA